MTLYVCLNSLLHWSPIYPILIPVRESDLSCLELFHKNISSFSASSDSLPSSYQRPCKMLVSGSNCEKCKMKLQPYIKFNILNVTRKMENQGMALQPSWYRGRCTRERREGYFWNGGSVGFSLWTCSCRYVKLTAIFRQLHSLLPFLTPLFFVVKAALWSWHCQNVA